MNEIIDKLKTVVFPKRCEICGSVIEFDAVRCSGCTCLPEIQTPICKKCGCKKSECICKKSHRIIHYNEITAPFYYKDTIPTGVLNLKENEMPQLALSHGAYISQAVKDAFGGKTFDFVTFVPMRRHAEMVRGFNQAQLLAKVVSANCSIELADILYKKRRTKMQKRQGMNERFANMYNAFAVKKGVSVNGADILVIDDVKTTGATLSSVAHTLKANGANSVCCAVFAIVK
ncbi:MAG: hypothetical protein LUH82_06015 [Clostridiales bacterium]|nr:hypothetical protein [Clostridiales bacterium]